MSIRATITDVARLAQVSKVTVSYVLNGRGNERRISAATQDRVKAAAIELGYAPSAIARSMVRGSLETLGVVFQHAHYFADQSDFTMELMHGVTQGALASGYNLMLHTKPVPSPEAEIAELMNGSVSGVLALRNEDDEVLIQLIERKFPLVMFFTRLTRPDVAFVDTDNRLGAELATEHLVSLGHRRLGMISGDPHSKSAQDRIAGFMGVLAKHGIPFREDDLAYVATGQEIDKIRHYASRPSLPTAVFCFSDFYAFHLMMTAAERGIKIPTDMSIVGFDSVQACERSNPRLTSVRQPVREIADEAVRLLVRLVHGEPVEQRQIVFPASLDIRESTCPPR